MEQFSDAEWVRLAQNGDKRAFDVLCERYHALAIQVAYQRVGLLDLAQDLAQESLLQAYLSLGQLQNPASFKSWLYGITLNVCRNYFRAQHHERDHDGGRTMSTSDWELSPEDHLERVELQTHVLQAVARLSPVNRAAIYLFYYEGLSVREASATLGIKISAFKGRLHKARQQLQLDLRVSDDRLTQGAKTMIPVQIVDVIRRTSTNQTGHTFTHCVLILYHAETRRALAIWVGEVEGLMIAQGLLKISVMTRPMTSVFMLRLLEATGGHLERVEISALHDEVFYATVAIRQGEQHQRFDARPSDALMLAVQTDAPLYVDETLMQTIGVTVPEHQSAGRGLTAYSAMLEQMRQASQSAVATAINTASERDQLMIAIIQEAFEA
ncbi:MAG: DUF151 domain-containing protein [Anaerolineae bacterium]|nr:DUF151 domain-containing protein [Anaerolineae bacterium]